jgi:hypothetical protein
MNDIKQNSNEALCAQIVAYRAFKINKNIAEQCMEELLRRKKEDKSDFNYEAFIAAELDKLPKPNNTSLENIFSILTNTSKDFINNIKNDKK